MTVELVRDLWWLVFPAFGMAMACWGMAREARYEDDVIARARSELEQRQ